MTNSLSALIARHLDELCVRISNRAVGSLGNRAATRYFTHTAKTLGYQVNSQTFDCLDWEPGDVTLTCGSDGFTAFPSPYSNGCEVTATLVTASNEEELAALDCAGKILLLRVELTSSQLMPMNFHFYLPEEHERIYKSLLDKQPAALITASVACPELAGALYPFPVIEDGDFPIPSVFTTDEEGKRLIDCLGTEVTLISRCRRLPAQADALSIIIGNPDLPRILISAHIDTKKGTPGAIDNATGVAVLLTLLELLRDYTGKYCLEILPFNGEDYYAAPAERLYLSQRTPTPENTRLCINLDAAGLKGRRTGYSFLNLSDTDADLVHSSFRDEQVYAHTEFWWQSDQGIFAQMDIPCLVLSSESIMEVLTDIAHTTHDTIDNVDAMLLADAAWRLYDLVSCIE